LVLYTNPFIFEKLNYLHNNPVRSGIVERPEEYIYSSAKNYADMPALLEIIKLTLPLIAF
jgi:putative transposase